MREPSVAVQCASLVVCMVSAVGQWEWVRL